MKNTDLSLDLEIKLESMPQSAKNSVYNRSSERLRSATGKFVFNHPNISKIENKYTPWLTNSDDSVLNDGKKLHLNELEIMQVIKV